MTVFEFVLILVLITTVGKVITEIVESRRIGPADAEGPALEHLRDAVNELSSRVHELEEERDFYRQLLEAPEESRKTPGG